MCSKKRSKTGNIPLVQRKIDSILENNRKWIENKTQESPEFFEKLRGNHTPEILWIGCADARVPPDQLLGQNTNPGTVFVHRNIANMVQGIDVNVMSVLQYAVSVLKVKHIMVCGHYECGGVKAAMETSDHQSPLEDWLRNIRDVYRIHHRELDLITDPQQRYRRLTELNVVEQTLNVFKTAVVQRSRVASSQDSTLPFAIPQVHAMIYEPGDGLLQELDVKFDSYIEQWDHLYSLYSKKGKLPMPPTDPAVLHDMLEAVMMDQRRKDAMEAVFHKYARPYGSSRFGSTANQFLLMNQEGFSRFLEDHLKIESSAEEREHAFKLLGCREDDIGIDFLQLVGWWRALEIKVSGSMDIP